MSQEIRKRFATKIKKLREKSKLKKESLSLLLDFDNSYISKLEKGNINITIDRMGKIAGFFQVDIKNLF